MIGDGEVVLEWGIGDLYLEWRRQVQLRKQEEKERRERVEERELKDEDW